MLSHEFVLTKLDRRSCLSLSFDDDKSQLVSIETFPMDLELSNFGAGIPDDLIFVGCASLDRNVGKRDIPFGGSAGGITVCGCCVCKFSDSFSCGIAERLKPNCLVSCGIMREAISLSVEHCCNCCVFVNSTEQFFST